MFRRLFKSFSSLGASKMIFVVRTDVKMSQGKIASQCAHAAIVLYESCWNSNKILLKSWILRGQPKVVLKMDQNCENRMNELYKKAKESDLNACLIRDAGKTQVTPGTVTVLGIGPASIEEIDKLTSNLRLL